MRVQSLGQEDPLEEGMAQTEFLMYNPPFYTADRKDISNFLVRPASS